MTTWTKITKASGTAWTVIAKPSSGAAVTIAAGEPIGLLLALTYASSSSFTTDIWTRITKASGTAWTNIPKAV